MTPKEKLFNRLMAWSKANQNINEWIERHPVTPHGDGGDRDEFIELRRRFYQAEWDLMSLSPNREALARATPDWMGTDEREVLYSLRSAMADLNFSAERYTSSEADDSAPAGSVNAWWFIPYVVWVGHPARGRTTSDPTYALLQETIATFRKTVLPSVGEAIKEELGGAEDFGGCQMHAYMNMDANVLRDFPLPGLPFEEWSPEDQALLQFKSGSSSPFRKGCVGFFFQGTDYQSVAMMRDLVREVAISHLDDLNSQNVQFGALLPRLEATQEAELIQWDMWVDGLLSDPLAAGASERVVALRVFQENAIPKGVVAFFQDRRADDSVVHEGQFQCQLFTPQMLVQAFDGLMESPRTDLRWSIEKIEMADSSPNGD